MIEVKKYCDKIIITLPLDNLVSGFNNNPKTEDLDDEGNCINFKVTNEDDFLNDLAIELNYDNPDTGATRITNMLDEAFNEMLDQGALGISDEKSINE